VSNRSTARFVAEALLRPYAQIIFSRDLASGAFVLLGIAAFPKVAAATMLAVVVAGVTSWLLGFGVDTVRDGTHACAAVLTTLATAFALGTSRIELIVAGAVLAVLFIASFQAAFVRVALPTHSLPLVAAAWTVNLAARALPATAPSGDLWSPWTRISESLLQPTWLDVPASIVFMHGAITGALILVAIAFYSRIGLLLAGVGAIAAMAMRAVFRDATPWSGVDLTASFNAVLAAMALGGVWYVPQPSSILLAAFGAMLSCVVTYALVPVAGALALPLLSLPFVLTTYVFLTALRMRQHDRTPSSAIPAERPEATLSHHLMRVRRFGDFAWLPFRLPFRGTWVVTQGHNGAHTHRGLWRFGLDFEVRGADGQTFVGDGRNVQDYKCYGLPVLAAGGGAVDQVIDGVADNSVGGVNAKDNWGNAVVIAHGPSLYSVYAHLQPKSVRVRPGDQVKAGAEIGRCGNSGRSFVPRLHFHVQRSPVLGSETIPADFGDVVSRSDDRATVAHRVIPRQGDFVRPVGRDESLAATLAFPPGSEWRLVETTTRREEIARVEIDLLGRRVLRSSAAQLYIDPYETGFVVVAFTGRRDSLLRYLLLGLARVPFDQEASLTWTDRVPRGLTLTGPWTIFGDLVSVVAPRLADFGVTYTSRRSEAGLAIEGAGAEFTTRAAISLTNEPHRVEVEQHGHRSTVEMSQQPDTLPDSQQ
jgi:murein DD-endopeptidase MepM/ murein hydrolase activator NlpD